MFGANDGKPALMGSTIRFDEKGSGYVGRPSGTYRGVFDVSIKGAIVSKDILDGIDPQDLRPWMVLDSMQSSGRYNEEEIAETMQLLYPIGLCYLFVTYEITNKTQSTISTRCLYDIEVCMFDADRQICYGIGANWSAPAYKGYDDFPDGVYWSYLRLLPGETREITMGYRLNANNCLDAYILEYVPEGGEWQFLLYKQGFNNATGGGWVLDDNKVVYINFERS